MSELGGALLLLAGLGALAATGGLAACCLRLRSLVEYLLATYVVAWSWLVAATLVLSPARLVTRGWLVSVLAGGLVVALVAWKACGMTRPPRMRGSIDAVREGLSHPAVLVLAGAVAIGLAYTLALAFFTPVNDGDGMAYHLARAAFWRQEHGLGYVQGSADLRLDVNPPNAEIGQLATLVLAGSDRFVALPQILAYGVLVLSVAVVARRSGLDVSASLFGALAFATLPVAVVQASGPLNDLVVASFLSCAVVFALRPRRTRLGILALAVGLAVGTKFTAVLAFPALALVVVAGRSRRAWPGIALAAVAGTALGSAWYILNLVETGELDGGLGSHADQRAEPSLAAMTTTALRLGLDTIDMSGASRSHSLLFLAAAAVLALAASTGRLARYRRGLLAGAVLTASVVLLHPLAPLVERGVEGAWSLMGRPETPSFDDKGPVPNDDATSTWYGPLGTLLLVLGPAGVVLARRQRPVPILGLGLGLALVLAPWVMLVTVAVTLVWDPYRGRFLMLGVALAASTWGLWLRRPGVTVAITAIGVVTLFLSLGNYLGKPSGFGELWPRGSGFSWSEASIWGDTRSQAQVRLRPGGSELSVLEHVAAYVPTDADIAIAPRENDFLSPYFGPRLSRHVSLLRPGDPVPPAVEWLVLSPEAGVRECDGPFEETHSNAEGWRVARRIFPGKCYVASQAEP